MNLDLPIVFGAGLATLVTPCILPLIPLWLGMLMGTGLEAARDPGGRFRLVTATLAFALGFTLVFTFMGLGASFAGGLLTRHREPLTIAGGVLVVLFSLKFLGLIRIPWLDRETRLPVLRTGHRLLDASLFGVVFALGWTPCVGPILGTVLTFTAARSGNPWVGGGYLAVYALGIALPLVAVSALLDRLLPLLDRLKGRLATLERVTGVALAILGLVLVGSGSWSMIRSVRADSGFVADSGAIVAPLDDPAPRPRLVELYRTDCPVCQEVMPRVEELKADCLGRKIDIHSVNLSDPRNRGAAEHFGVTAVPTFVLLDEGGTEMGRVVGGIELPELRRAAALLMGANCAGIEAGDLGRGEGGCPDEPAAAPLPWTLDPGPSTETCGG